jgi:hypothetical protein
MSALSAGMGGRLWRAEAQHRRAEGVVECRAVERDRNKQSSGKFIQHINLHFAIRENGAHFQRSAHVEWTPILREPVNSSNTWNGEYWDDLSEEVFQGV